MPTRDREWTTCSVCGVSLLAKNLAKHRRRGCRLAASSLNPSSIRTFNRRTVKCSACGTVVRRSSMRDHIRVAHPKLGRPQASGKKPSAGDRLEECPICCAAVRRDRLKKHMSKVHPDTKPPRVRVIPQPRVETQTEVRPVAPTTRRSSSGDRLVRCKRCGVFMERALPDDHQCKEQSRTTDWQSASGQLLLLSDRSGMVRGGGRCNEGGYSAKVVWRYRQSNRGVVQLCRRCRPKVLDRTFGGIDALDRAWLTAFETDRQRH
jgi:hypothetical protein